MDNAFNTNFSSFRGWISTRGLPFNSWTLETFKSIAHHFGRLIKIDEQISNHHNLVETKIRVDCQAITLIPHIISFPINNRWIPLQLTPIFSIEVNSPTHCHNKGQIGDHYGTSLSETFEPIKPTSTGFIPAGRAPKKSFEETQQLRMVEPE